MWAVTLVLKNYFDRNYKKIRKTRNKTTINILFETSRRVIKANTDKDVLKGDIVSVPLANDIYFGVVSSVNEEYLGDEFPEVIDGYYDSLNQFRVEHENECSSEQALVREEEPEEKFFEQIKSHYDEIKIFFVNDRYSVNYNYEKNDNDLKPVNIRNTCPYYTRLKISPGDLVVSDRFVGIVRYVSKPRNDYFTDDSIDQDMIFFKGDGDIRGSAVIKKYLTRRETIKKKLLSQSFLTSCNNVVLVNHNEGKAQTFDGKEVTFKICRSLKDMLYKVAKYKPHLLPLLTDDNGEYRDSHFASERIIKKLLADFPEQSSFDGSFDGLLKRLAFFVDMLGYTKERKAAGILGEREYRDKKGYGEYANRDMLSTHFAGVNLPKNFADKDTFCFDVEPFYISEESRRYYFNRKEAFGLTIYNHAYDPMKIKYHNEVEYDERYGYRSVGGYWELNDEVVESYAILLLNENPPVFSSEFYERNIIFELDGKFYAYYVFREKKADSFVNPQEIYNNPVAYYINKGLGTKDYGLAHKVGSNAFDGAFAKDCHDLDNDQCTSIFYCCDHISDLPEINDHFYKDRTGIYSLDGKILYFAFGESTKQYVVKDGVEEIRSYAFGYLKKVETLILANSVKKIGSLREPISKSKPILCPKLKEIAVPEAMIKEDIVKRCICGDNIKKNDLKKIMIYIRE